MGSCDKLVSAIVCAAFAIRQDGSIDVSFSAYRQRANFLSWGGTAAVYNEDVWIAEISIYKMFILQMYESYIMNMENMLCTNRR